MKQPETRLAAAGKKATGKKATGRKATGEKEVPPCRTEVAERRFWATHDSTDYVDWSRAREVTFPNLQPSTETISLRLPEGLLADLKVLANRMDVPFQSLLKVYLAERVQEELRRGLDPEALAELVREPEAPYGNAPAGTHRPRAGTGRHGNPRKPRSPAGLRSIAWVRRVRFPWRSSASAWSPSSSSAKRSRFSRGAALGLTFFMSSSSARALPR